MKKTTIVCACVFALVLSSCNPKPKAEQPAQKKEVKVGNLLEEVTALRERHVKDSTMIGNTTFVYEYHFTNCDTLPKVRNTEGYYYYDNQLRLKVTKGSSTIFERVFMKQDFAEFVPENMLEKSLLVGFTFNPLNTTDPSALHFFVTVGNPDETADEDFTMDMRITPSGNMTLEKATNIDTEPLSPGMTVNPGTDDGV